MRLNHLLLFLVIIISNIEVNSQTNTFSKLYPLKPYAVSIFNAVVVTDSAYFVTGIFGDSISPYRTLPLFVKTDTDGNVLLTNSYKDGIKEYEPWFQGLFIDNQGRITTNGYIFNNPSKNHIFLIRYFKDGSKDTIIELTNDFEDSGLTSPILLSQKNNYLLSVYSTYQDITYNFINELNQSGQLINKFQCFKNYKNANITRLDTTKAGFIVGAWSSPTSPVKNGINQTVIEEIDTLGNKVWEYSSPVDEDWCGLLGGIIVNSKNEVIYVSGKGTIEDPKPIVDIFKYTWYITKLDRNKKIVWRTLIPSTYESVVEVCRFWNILKLKSGKEYLTMGMDFMREPRYFGWLAKFNDDGVLLWNRKYNVEDIMHTKYEIRDIAEDKNGNLIAVGERLRTDINELNNQQAWMMKLDSYGCLEPGCHLIATKDINKESIDINIYPNPASDFISFNLKEDLIQRVDYYKIFDFNGQVVYEKDNLQSGITYVLQTKEFISGIYTVSFFNNEQNVLSKKINIIH